MVSNVYLHFMHVGQRRGTAEFVLVFKVRVYAVQ